MAAAEKAGATSALLGADAVYFLMWPGWENELRSNRWHYAIRWARILPVVLLQPTQATAELKLVTREEPRIPNCRVLWLKSSGCGVSYLEDTLVQLGQVAVDMAVRGVQRPLLWCYNPNLVGLYAALPAVARIFHATENYFHFDGVSQSILDRQRAAVRLSDITVAVSEGVAVSIRENVPEARVQVVTNGCDYSEYSRYREDERVQVTRGAYDRVGIYAGNINGRLDFALLRRCVRENPGMLFVFAGPVAHLSDEDETVWRGLLVEPNVQHLGPVEAGTLPGLYRASDVGIIPYKQTKVLVENGFPLKALEMCATGLPVVSTWMKPIEALMDALVVARDHDSFQRALSCLSRSTVTSGQREEMRCICQLHDYDRKFAAVLELLTEHVGSRPSVVTRLDGLLASLLTGEWGSLGLREWESKVGDVGVIGRPGAVRSVRLPRMLKAVVVMWLALQESDLRGLLSVWAKCRRREREIGLIGLMEDLLRLVVLHQQAALRATARAAFVIKLDYESNKAEILVESARLMDGSPDSARGRISGDESRKPIRRILWDHSAVGMTVPCRLGRWRFWVFVGPGGRYEFRALSALARHHAERVWAAFRALAEAAG